MTTWSDEKLLAYIDRQIESSDSSSTPIAIIKVESVDDFIKENHCMNLEDVITELRGVI